MYAHRRVRGRADAAECLCLLTPNIALVPTTRPIVQPHHELNDSDVTPLAIMAFDQPTEVLSQVQTGKRSEPVLTPITAASPYAD